MAIFKHEWRAAIAWMILAMFVNGFDGMLARWADVKRYADGIDGALLDNILDYINYVLVPALFLVESDFILPEQFRLVGAFAILLISAYQFTQTDAKTEDHYFKRLTIILTYLYSIIGIWAAMQYPNVPVWAVWVTLVYVVYYVVLSLWPRERLPQNA